MPTITNLPISRFRQAVKDDQEKEITDAILHHSDKYSIEVPTPPFPHLGKPSLEVVAFKCGRRITASG